MIDFVCKSGAISTFGKMLKQLRMQDDDIIMSRNKRWVVARDGEGRIGLWVHTENMLPGKYKKIGGIWDVGELPRAMKLSPGTERCWSYGGWEELDQLRIDHAYLSSDTNQLQIIVSWEKLYYEQQMVRAKTIELDEMDKWLSTFAN